MRVFILFVFVFSGAVFSESKILTCTDYDVEDRIEDFKKDIVKYTQEYGEDHKITRGYKGGLNFMLAAGWSFRTEVVFDTDDLKKEASNPKAEMTRFINGGYFIEGPISVKIETTPTTISFLYSKFHSWGEEELTLVVNRQNLVASVGSSDGYECILEDMDTSANIL